MRLKLTFLGTLWISICIAAFFWFGMTFIHDEATAFFYYGFAWIFAAIPAGVPFILYSSLGDK